MDIIHHLTWCGWHILRRSANGMCDLPYLINIYLVLVTVALLLGWIYTWFRYYNISLFQILTSVPFPSWLASVWTMQSAAISLQSMSASVNRVSKETARWSAEVSHLFFFLIVSCNNCNHFIHDFLRRGERSPRSIFDRQQQLMHHQFDLTGSI